MPSVKSKDGGEAGPGRPLKAFRNLHRWPSNARRRPQHLRNSHHNVSFFPPKLLSNKKYLARNSHLDLHKSLCRKSVGHQNSDHILVNGDRRCRVPQLRKHRLCTQK